MYITNTQASALLPRKTIIETKPIQDILKNHSIEELKYKYDHSNSKEKPILEKEILRHIILTSCTESYNTDSEYFLFSEEKSIEFAADLISNFSDKFKLGDIQDVISDLRNCKNIDFTAFNNKTSKHETDEINPHVYNPNPHQYWNNGPNDEKNFMEKKLDILIEFMIKNFPER